jgi:hypothetical protein
MMPTGSNPAFSQKVLSSMAVVASRRIGGMSSNATMSRLYSPNRASSTSPVRSYRTVSSGSWYSVRVVGSGRPDDSDALY